MTRLLPHFVSRYPDLIFVAVAGLAAAALAFVGYLLAAWLDRWRERRQRVKSYDRWFKSLAQTQPQSPRRWLLGCYFDYEQEVPQDTNLDWRVYLRLRSDGVVYWQRMARVWADEPAREAALTELFEHYLTDDDTPGAPKVSSREFWATVDVNLAQAGRDGGHDLVVDIGQRRACDEARS